MEGGNAATRGACQHHHQLEPNAANYDETPVSYYRIEHMDSKDLQDCIQIAE
jgi:hypothetical protein